MSNIKVPKADGSGTATFIDSALTGVDINVFESNPNTSIEIMTNTTPISSELTVYWTNDSETEFVNFIESGEVVAREPASYYSIYNSSISSDTLYLNSTISDARMTGFFNALQYPQAYEGNIPYERLSSITLSDSECEISAINANSLQSGLKILALTKYNYSTEVFTVVPFYATQAYDFTSQGWGSGVQGWQNIEYQLPETIVIENIDNESYFTIKTKDLVALDKAAFGDCGSGVQMADVTIKNSGLTTTNVEYAYLDSNGQFIDTSSSIARSGSVTVQTPLNSIFFLWCSDGTPTVSGAVQKTLFSGSGITYNKQYQITSTTARFTLELV